MDKITSTSINLLIDDMIQEENQVEDDVLQMECFIEMFTKKNPLFRMLSCAFLSDLIHIRKSGKEEYTYYGKYPFKCLSDFSLSNDELRDTEKSYNNRILRSMQIALSKKLINAKLITVIQKDEDNDFLFNLLIEYEKNNKKLIIDYLKNLIMEKEDYYHVYHTREIQTLAQPELYSLMEESVKSEIPIDKYTLLISGNELLKNKKGKYHSTGIHKNNDFVLKNEDVCSTSEYYLSPMDKEIQEFMKNPQGPTKNITYSKKRKCYFYKKTPFKLLFDLEKNDTKEQYLLKKGTGSCHENSLLVMEFLEMSGVSAQLISGKIRKNNGNEIDYTLVETEKNVIDFNRNLIMEKDNYYKMTGFTVINKTDKKLLDENKNLLSSYGIDMDSKIIGYFSQEFNHDLAKNKLLLKKKS